jgi:hypothetical protein
MTDRWREPGFVAEAHAWIEARLDDLGISRIGDIEQPHVFAWSTVMRVPTDRGDVWFKATTAELRHEAAIVDILSVREPDLVPPLLAHDRGNGWMLMPDAGETLRKVIERERSLDRWLDVLPRYARLQLAHADRVDDLLAAGVPDLRLATLPERYDRLIGGLDVEQRFREATPYVAELCERLASYGIAETIQHDDLHDAQVFVREGRHLVMDWGDACVTHPFLTLSVTLEGVIAWGVDDVEGSVDIAPYRDAYLRPFTEEYGGDLVPAVDAALRLGWVCRTVNGYLPDDGPGLSTRLRMFLDGRA